MLYDNGLGLASFLLNGLCNALLKAFSFYDIGSIWLMMMVNLYMCVCYVVLYDNYDSKDKYQVLMGYTNLVPRSLSLVLINNQKQMV